MPLIRIGSAELSAALDPLGAQLSRLQDGAGRDLLWGGDPAVWAGRAPILFPIIGELAGGVYRLGAKTYSLSRHGFARGSRFEVLDHGAAEARFRLSADAASMARYPFPFELELHFAIQGATLQVTATARNLGQAAMPVSMGFHPGFCWPLPFGQPRAAHYLEFAADEDSPARRLDAHGLLTATRHPTPIHARRLVLDDALFHDDALIFDALRSRSVSYGAAEGPRIRVDFPDSPFLGIWTKPAANFICIEPWQGIADPQGYAGDFMAKPGIHTVMGGASHSLRMAITLQQHPGPPRI